MNIKGKIAVIEFRIDKLIEELMLEDAYRLPRTEERITALLLARQYLKEKESENEG